MLQTIEAKYQVQIQNMTENHARESESLEDKIRKYERELARTSEQLKLDSHAKWGNQFLNERKFNEMLENEKKLGAEIAELKSENERQTKDQYRHIEGEREAYKAKLQDVEARAKVAFLSQDSENRRNQLIFENEKQKAQWNMERDQLLIQKGELQVIRSTQDNLNRSERKKELLLRENEKLKADFKTQKRNSNASQLISNPCAMNFMRNTLIQTTNVNS